MPWRPTCMSHRTSSPRQTSLPPNSPSPEPPLPGAGTGRISPSITKFPELVRVPPPLARLKANLGLLAAIIDGIYHRMMAYGW